ncbi:MAG: radical SAM protein [Candidatus Zixiibacteriota bacterium]|nr:MAG: radical SAM protein [candidate division Zixibacteria bacterium]
MTTSGQRKYSSIGWGITRRCNLSCPHCYTSAAKTSTGELTTEECREIIDLMPGLGAENIGWTGGEPLLRKDLEELMRYAQRYGITSSITTNGIPLTKRRVAKLAEVGLRALQISLDGSTPEKNRNIRRARLADFELVINGAKMCLEAGLPVTLAMIISRDTIDDVMDYVAMARNLGVNSIRFCGFVPHGDAEDGEARHRLEFSDHHRELYALVERLVDVESPTIVFDAGHGPVPPGYSCHQCNAGTETFYISDNGDVYPCTGLLYDRFKVGNLRLRPLLELIDDPKMSEMARYDHSQIHGHCRDCQYFRVCRGACRGATYAHTGDLNASFPVCLFRASLLET